MQDSSKSVSFGMYRTINSRSTLKGANIYKTACYEDDSTPSESYRVVGFVLLERFYPAGVKLHRQNI